MRLGSSLPELVDPIALLYADFPLVEEGGLVDFDVRVELPSFVRGRLLRQAVTVVDGQPSNAVFERRLALPMFEWAINWCVFSRPNQYLLLHSAVLERAGHALLLSGKPGAGKSTLCAALVLRGWRLLSDEVAMIPPGTRRTLPVPRPVSLKERSIEIIREYEPRAVIGPSCPGTRKGTVAHMQPPADSVARAEEPATPSWIVFPRYAVDAATDLVPVTRADAMLRVAGEAFNYSLLGTTGFETLATVVDTCACFELPYGDLDEAVALFDDLAAPGPARTGGGDLAESHGADG